MRASRTGPFIAALVLGIGISACGDDENGDQAESPTTTKSPAAETKEAPPAKSSVPGLAAPGQKFKIGETARVGWQPPSVASKDTADVVKLDVTVLSLKQGSPSDLKGIQLGEDQKGKTPYYAQIRMQNVEGTPADFEEPNLGFAIVDDTGKFKGRTLFRDLAPCKEAEAPKPFTEGKSYETCFVFLAQGSVKEVQWREGPRPAGEVPAYLEHPVVWQP